MSFSGECKRCQFCLDQLQATVVLPPEAKAKAIAGVFKVVEQLDKRESKNLRGVYLRRTSWVALDTPHPDEEENVPGIHEQGKIEEYVLPNLHADDVKKVKDDKDYWVNGVYQGNDMNKENERDAFMDLDDVRLEKLE